MKLALDEAAEDDRLVTALRKKFRSPADMLTALGIDVSVLEEGSMRTRDDDARNRDGMQMRRARDLEEMMPGEFDRRSRDRGRDQDPEEERELEELMAMLRDMSAQDRRMVADWMRSRTPTYDRRMMGRDQPPPFEGMPMPGGGMVGGSMS